MRREEETQSTTDMLASAWQEALQRHVVDVLKGAKLEKMARDIGFWAYRLDDAFPADMHNKLVTLINESFEGVLRLIAEKTCQKVNFTARI
ncbi:MAG: hypothetical protein ACKPKO_32460 [Candidatus Fonsibacter sp.]